MIIARLFSDELDDILKISLRLLYMDITCHVFGEWLKGWANPIVAPEIAEFSEKNL